jgi:hypothetical protein
MSQAPLRLHPANPKLFEFRGAPRVLVCATEHYGAVMNRPFDFKKHLADAAEKKQTLTRLFTLFREMQSPQNPYSTCKPESPDYISPFRRTGSGLALDCQPKYDLDQWNPEFFERLHQFLSLASDYGIVVEVVLLSNTYAPGIWTLNPLHHENNINGLEGIAWPDYLSTRHSKLFARQCAHVRKIVEETNQYDNIIYEICNEPGGLAEPDSPTVEEVNAWQMAIAEVIRQTEARLPNRHLIAGQEAFAYRLPDESRRCGPDVHQFADQSFDTLAFDVVNMHPLSNMIYRGKHLDLGQFMMARLRLRNLRQYCRDLYQERKPLNLDEDNCASQYKDINGWTIHRKRAWMTLLCGAHYDMIDFSIINYCETGTPESQRCLRTWMKHLSEFVHSLDLVQSRPLHLGPTGIPDHVIGSAFGVREEDFAIYFADARELDEPGHGDSIKLDLVIPLEAHEHEMRSYSPTSGLYSPSLHLRGEPKTPLHVPPFTHDIVIRISRVH